MSLAGATETSMDGAMSAVSPELELYQNIFSVKEEQRTALKGFLSGKHVVLHPAGFGSKKSNRSCFECDRQIVCPITFQV